jgi:hypothetical protein
MRMKITGVHYASPTPGMFNVQGHMKAYGEEKTYDVSGVYDANKKEGILESTETAKNGG